MIEIKETAEAGIARLNAETPEEEKKDDTEAAEKEKKDDSETAEEEKKDDAEDKTSESETTQSETAATVKTGDTSSLFAWAAMVLGSLAAALAMAFGKRRA